MGLTNHMSTWAANFHKEFLKKPNKRLRNLINQSYKKLNTFKGLGNGKVGRLGRGLVFLKGPKNLSVRQSLADFQSVSFL